jgi:flavin-dependent dehydrogenase
MDDRHVDADVVVVGGGPAGAAAAISCATRNLRVTLLERDVSGRERPGETLHPGAEPLLAQLGIADRLPAAVGVRHTGIWTSWGGPAKFEPFGADADGPWSGLQAWRVDFDALLLARARELGVNVRQPAAVTGLLKGGGVATSSGPVAARMVVDATGRARWLARLLGLRSPARSPPLLVRFGYAQGSCPARDDAPAIVGDRTGWTWTALVKPGLYQWTRLCFGESPGADWMPEEFRGLTPRSKARGADVTWRMAEQTAGPGWFMVGDAAATLDPTSSHGVLKALMSGMMAAHLTAAVVQGKSPAEETARAYHRWITDWFETDVDRLTTFYRKLGAVGF